MGWEVEFVTETFYTVKWYPTEAAAQWAANSWLASQEPWTDPKVWVRPAR